MKRLKARALLGPRIVISAQRDWLRSSWESGSPAGKHVSERGAGKVGIDVVDGRGVEAEIGAIHHERGTHLSTDLGLDAPRGVGEQLQRRPGDVPRCALTSRGGLQGLGELVEG